MPDLYTNQLSAYLDDELDGASRARLEAHLSGCSECAALLADLRAIVAAAPALRRPSTVRDLWTEHRKPPRRGRGHLDRSGPRPSARPPVRRFGWRELIAASIVMAAVGGGAVYLALASGHSGPGSRPLAQRACPGRAEPSRFVRLG